MKQNIQVKHGNYHKYYEFRSDDSRSRILRQHLEPLWNKLQKESNRETDIIHMLDVGCNSGQFTAKVHQLLQDVTGQKVRALGFDIDDELCKKARSSFPEIDFISGDVLNIVKRQDGNDADPVAQWMENMEVAEFDVICCFSVLMYIQLNGGDAGLRAVLDYLCAKGKLLVIELQAWKKYRDQVKRLRRDAGDVYPLYRDLEWRGGCGKLELHIKNHISANGFELLWESSDKNEFDRQMIVFKKTKNV